MAKAQAAAAKETTAANKVSRGVKEDKAEPKERARKYDASLKVKILKKDAPWGRENSNRRAAWDAIVASKTMADYYASGHKIKYVKTWIDEQLIEVG